MTDDYTPNTGRTRHAATEPYGTRITGAEFDRWLTRVKANTWDEAVTAHEFIRARPCPLNPYRKGTP